MSTQSDPLRILLVGLGPTTFTALEGLADEHDVVAAIRDTDDEATALARELDVPVLTDATVAGVAAAIERLDPDGVVVSSFNRILGPDIVGDRPFINVHYAPLPRYRGRAPVNWALLNGDDEAAISIHHLVPALDAGALLYQGFVPIGPQSTVATLYAELNQLQRHHIAGAIRAACAGDPGRAQDESRATYGCTRVPDDGEIDWTRSTDDISRLVRALQAPFPAAFTWLGLERVHVLEAHAVAGARAYEGRIPGRVVAVDRRAGTADVLTGDGVLRLVRLQRDVGEPQDAASIVTSVRFTLGLRTTDLVAELLARRP